MATPALTNLLLELEGPTLSSSAGSSQQRGGRRCPLQFGCLEGPWRVLFSEPEPTAPPGLAREKAQISLTF